MKKVPLVHLMIAALLAALLTGCAGAGDWASEPLAANYEIWRLSAHDIKLVKRTAASSASTVIDAEIYAVSWDENYIFVQHEPMVPDETDDTKEPHRKLDYYILVVSSEEVLGPFTYSEFEAACLRRDQPVPQEWVLVRDLPRQTE